MSAQKCSFAATDVKHPIASRAILHKTFSDSFLGDEPYKNISPHNIVTHVGSGCRMTKPAKCSDEV